MSHTTYAQPIADPAPVQIASMKAVVLIMCRTCGVEEAVSRFTQCSKCTQPPIPEADKVLQKKRIKKLGW